MKKLSIIVVLVLAVAVWSCSDVKREQNRVYMPDMAYSRAIETYSDIDTLEKQGIHYNRMPVPGTVKRGELAPFSLAADKPGDTTNYLASRQIQDPLPKLNDVQMKEAERLYLVNCAICHGVALDGMGPLHANDGPFKAAPANLATGANYVSMPAGQMFFSVTYGKGQMGSYASQLSSTQRWMVIQYVKSKQGGGQAAGAAGADTTKAAAGTGAAAASDTAAKK